MNIKIEDIDQANEIKLFGSSIIIWSLITYILMFGWGLNSNSITLAILLIGTIIFIKNKCENKFYVLLYFIPYIYFIRPYSINIAFYKIWMMIYILNLLMYKPKFKIDQVLIVNLIIIPVTINYVNIGLVEYISFIMSILIVFFTVLSEYKFKNFSIDFFKSSMYLSMGFLNSAILGYLLRIFFPDKIAYFKDVSSIPGEFSMKILRFSGTMKDPNYFAQGILICIACLMICYINRIKDKNKYKINKLIYFIFICLLIIIGLRTYSKMYLLSLGILLVIFYSYILVKDKNYLRKIIFTLSMIIGFILIFRSDFMNIIIGRLSGTAGLTSGRIDILKNAFELVESKISIIFIGIGIGEAIKSFFGHVMHNVYIEYIFSIGIIAYSLWIILLISNCKEYLKINNVYRYIIAIVLIVTGFSLDGLWVEWHYYYLIIMIISIKQFYNYKILM